MSERRYNIEECDTYARRDLTSSLTLKDLEDAIGVIVRWIEEYKIKHPEEASTLPIKKPGRGRRCKWTVEERDGYARKYLTSDLTLKELADTISVTPSTILQWVKAYKTRHPEEESTFLIKKRGGEKAGRRCKWAVEEQDEYARKYLTSNLTQEEIADKIGVSRSTITQWVGKYKIRHPEELYERKYNIAECDAYARQYLTGDLTVKDFAETVGVNPSTILRWTKAYKIRHPEEASTLPIKKRGGRYKWTVEERDSYAIRYLTSNVSSAIIAEEAGVSGVTIRSWAKDYIFRHGVKKATKDSRRSIEERDAYVRQYLAGGLTKKETADNIGVSTMTITRWVKAYKIRHPEETSSLPVNNS